jgi:hypothetical protein
MGVGTEHAKNTLFSCLHDTEEVPFAGRWFRTGCAAAVCASGARGEPSYAACRGTRRL